MDDVKPWYTSVTIWGAILAGAAPIAGAILHVSISDADMQQIAALLAAVGAAIGGVMAIVGRVRATHTIGTSSASPSTTPKA